MALSYDTLPATIEVDRRALARILGRVNREGFLSNDLGVKYAPDEHGIATVLVSDAEVHFPPGPLPHAARPSTAPESFSEGGSAGSGGTDGNT